MRRQLRVSVFVVKSRVPGDRLPLLLPLPVAVSPQAVADLSVLSLLIGKMIG